VSCLMNWIFSAGPGNRFAGATGLPWVKAVAELLGIGPNVMPPNGKFTPPPLLMGFTVSASSPDRQKKIYMSIFQHDNNLPPVLAALGLWNDSRTSPLSPDAPDPRRMFRSSNFVSFRGYIALERLSCEAPLNSSVFHAAGIVNQVPGNSTSAARFVRVRVRELNGRGIIFLMIRVRQIKLP